MVGVPEAGLATGAGEKGPLLLQMAALCMVSGALTQARTRVEEVRSGRGEKADRQLLLSTAEAVRSAAVHLVALLHSPKKVLSPLPHSI